MGGSVEAWGVPRTGLEEEGRPGRLEFERGSEAAMAAEVEEEGTGGGVGMGETESKGRPKRGSTRLYMAKPWCTVGRARGCPRNRS